MKNIEDIKYIIYLHLLMLFYSIGTIFSKFASGFSVFSKEFILLYMGVLGVLFIYAVLWQKILKKMSLITAYANKAVTVIWGMIWGSILFQEEISYTNIIGAVIIIAGVYFVVTGGEE